jgi:hypothetical protein
VFVIDTVNGYVEAGRRAVVVIVSVEATVLPVEDEESGLNPPLAPAGSPEIEKSKVQATLLPLNVRVMPYVALLPTITGFGD